MYVLHGAASSPFVRKTWIFMKEKGVDCDERDKDAMGRACCRRQQSEQQFAKSWKSCEVLRASLPFTMVRILASSTFRGGAAGDGTYWNSNFAP